MNTVSAPAGIGAPVKMRIGFARADRLRRGAAGGQPTADREPRLGLGGEIARAAPRSRRRRNCRTAADRSARRRRRASTRPRAAASGTLSVSVTGAMRSAIIRSISAIGSSGPENAKQSSVSCAITRLCMAAAARLQRHRVLEQHVGDRPRCRSGRSPAPAPAAAACRRRWRRCADRPAGAAACRSRRGGFRASETRRA